MLRRCATSRVATGCTAHHGSFLPCSPVPLRCQRRCAGVCRPPSGHPCRPAQHLLQPTALSLRFFILVYADRSWRLTPLYSSGGRLSFSVGLAALVVCSSSSAPERSPLRAALRSRRAPHATAHAICARRPPPRSCQPPCVLHSRRVCFAVARLGASPLPARLGTVHSCRARPCTCTAKVAALDACRPKEATPAAPPNTCCSRPPSRCDFPSQRVPTILLLHTRALVGRRLSATVSRQNSMLYHLQT
jgi:hypothetical protein